MYRSPLQICFSLQAILQFVWFKMKRWIKSATGYRPIYAMVFLIPGYLKNHHFRKFTKPTSPDLGKISARPQVAARQVFLIVPPWRPKMGRGEYLSLWNGPNRATKKWWPLWRIEHAKFGPCMKCSGDYTPVQHRK